MASNSEFLMAGWHLTDEGVDLCKEGSDHVTSFAVIQKALDIDLRDIGAPFLDDLRKSGIEKYKLPFVLQIQKIRNVAAPKHGTSDSNSALYKLCVTDGHSNINCIQWDKWKSVNSSIPPGAKICIKSDKLKMRDGFLLLKDNQFTVLGGNVPSMIEKWELSKKFAVYQRINRGSEEGPPPWIAFGENINYNASRISSGGFRSLDAGSKRDGKEDTAFTQQRMANIAEVSRSKEGRKKVFGGGKDHASSENVVDSLTNSNAHSGRNSSSNFDVRKKYQDSQAAKFSEKRTLKTADTYQGKNKTEYKGSVHRYSENHNYADSSIKETQSNRTFEKRGLIPKTNIVQQNTASTFHRDKRPTDTFYNSNVSPRFSKSQESKSNHRIHNISNNVNDSFNQQSSSFGAASIQQKEDTYNGNAYQHNSPSQGKNQKKSDSALFYYSQSPNTYDGNTFLLHESYPQRGHFRGLVLNQRGTRPFLPHGDENYPEGPIRPQYYRQQFPQQSYFPRR